MRKPCEKDSAVSEVGIKKFYCRRKGKFGLNMQGVRDAKGHFLDMTIDHPGSTSDYLSFMTSKLHHKLEKPGFLAPNLVLHGDNACVSNMPMAAPHKNVSTGSKDECDFYHSQVRIRIECTFGILAHR